MKKLLLIFIGLLLITNLFSQNDSIHKSGFWIRPYFENGISFINNNNLKNSYETNSLYFLGFGLRLGNPNKNLILPYLQYGSSSVSYQYQYNGNVNATNKLKIQEFLVGIDLSLFRYNSNMLTAKLGYCYAPIIDDANNNSYKANGLQIGAGYEVKILRKFRIFINYSYDLIKLNHSIFRDYDIHKLTFGIVL
jgi:opacity protein-like surface antigen